ncbi:hypothetical protein SEA_CAMBIARE_34 [Mycobacterium phage Cambiare]|uniref:Uncharacterized protein n=1 Tax=Mycobacterium phage Cambiare TaxID=1647305 RepID=A0A0F6YQM5_9CAUD|nr:hypothetical protein AVT48_gp34 [Mycobacterium phage Cambiare]AKF14536.1 hypothetical protein SEA_CAMBIARE_34 [Mycobacterium phage Cambiare]
MRNAAGAPTPEHRPHDTPKDEFDMSENNLRAEDYEPDVLPPLPTSAPAPKLPYRRNPTLECDLCWAPPLAPCDPYCIARLSAAEQIAHRDAVIERTIDELDCTLGTVEGAPWAKRSDPEFVDLDDEDYRVTSCTIAGRHRARPNYERRVGRLRRVLIVAVVVLVAALAALWASQQAKADTFTTCPSGLSGVATADTSCEFADSVRASFYGQLGWNPIAYSPVTGKFYTMQCARAWTTNAWFAPKRCWGVNEYGVGLVVFIA